MIGTVKRIEQEICDLEIAIAEASKKMEVLRSQYIEVLSNAIAHQIILATYQLCTREYPYRFLALSVEAKHRLQQDIQVLANSFSQKILESITPDLSLENSELKLVLTDLDDSEIDMQNLNHSETVSSETNNPAINIPKINSKKTDPNDSESTDQNIADRNSLEQNVSLILVEASEAIDQLLANEGILSLPLSKDATSVQLRLLDLELSNRKALSIRSELRVLDARLQQLGSDVIKKQKAKLVAEAELAWRSTWIEWKQN